ncbi:hypothetical protein B0A49_13576, partial [Cryomyces minteri]
MVLYVVLIQSYSFYKEASTILIRSLKILQANLNKSETVQNALHNDEALKDIAAILGQGPSSFMSREKEKTTRPGTDLVVPGDFNRHDTLWGGPGVGETYRQGEAEPIIAFMDQHGLQSLLQPGVITFQRSRFRSTIDLSLASQWLASNLVRCTLWGNEYGSDHRAVLTEFDITEEAEQTEARLLVKHAQWPK